MIRNKLLFTQSTTSIDWLSNNLDHPNLVILDASIPSVNSNKSSEFTDVRILSARFFDLKNEFSDQECDLPAMMPTSELFEQSARSLGINRSSKIVVYDDLGIYSSPRVWWMFRAMGHENISVLDGGLPDWHRLGMPTEPITSKRYELGDFEAIYILDSISSLDEVKNSIHDDNVIVIDARSEGRFNGTAPEPREGLRSGCIPNSVNLPFGKVLQDGKMLQKAQLQSIFRELKISDQQLIFTCGSGITACIILLAAEIAGFNNKSVYDGAWCEWGRASANSNLEF